MITEHCIWSVCKNYDARGNVTCQRTLQSVDSATGAEIWSVINNTYDSMNRLVLVEENDGNSARFTRYTYDAAGRKLSQTEGLSAADATDGHTTTYAYNALGQFMTMTKPNGSIESYTYDRTGKMLTKTLPGGNMFTYAYDAQGNLISQIANKISSTIAHTFTYSDDGKLMQSSDENGVTLYTYDENGQVLSEIRKTSAGTVVQRNEYTYLPSGQKATYRLFTDSSNTVKQSLIYAYDDQNRLLSVTDGVSATKICCCCNY